MAHRIFSKLAVVAVLAASLPAAALAHDGDRDRDHRPAPVAVAPAPVYGHAPAPGWRDRGSWRERELHRVSGQLRALDAERAAFHARFAGNRWRIARYDRSYFERRAGLERRWSELSRVAWR